jgi:hypothetical protein
LLVVVVGLITMELLAVAVLVVCYTQQRQV